ncbi:hypothetical protein Tco_0767360 [Tanacetum coccineum]
MAEDVVAMVGKRLFHDGKVEVLVSKTLDSIKRGLRCSTGSKLMDNGDDCLRRFVDGCRWQLRGQLWNL